MMISSHESKEDYYLMIIQLKTKQCVSFNIGFVQSWARDREGSWEIITINCVFFKRVCWWWDEANEDEVEYLPFLIEV